MDILSGLTMGFLGSMHCAGMCGPLALALPTGTSAGWRFVLGRLLYNVGRTVTYLLLGALMGIFGGMLALAGVQQTFSIVVGLLMLATVFLPSIFRGLSLRWSIFQHLYANTHTMLSRLLERRTLPTLFSIGIVNGFLPCGLLYVALAAATTLAEPMRGMMFLAGFGIGTVPAMLGMSLAGKTLQTGLRQRGRFFLPALTIIIALLFILRGLNLGIPFVSPKAHTDHAATTGGSPCYPIAQY